MSSSHRIETSQTLLEQLCNEADAATWDRLLVLYSPLLRGWIDRYGVQAADADDLVQDVLIVVMRELPSFRHNQQTGAFRSWLRRIIVNRLRNFWRQRNRDPRSGQAGELMQQLDQLEDGGGQLSQMWDREHDRHVTKQLLALIEGRFTEKTRQAFRMLVVDGRDADDVAVELGMTLNAVFTAKSRVLRELRETGRGLLG